MTAADRFAAKARDVLMRIDVGDRDPVKVVAAALAAAHNEAIYACADIAEAQRLHCLKLSHSSGDDPWTPQDAAEQCEEIRDDIKALRVPEGK